VDGYEIRDVMLDLGSDVNILLKKSWEAMGKTRLVYYILLLSCGWPINIVFLPIGELDNVEVIGVR